MADLATRTFLLAIFLDIVSRDSETYFLLAKIRQIGGFFFRSAIIDRARKKNRRDGEF